MEKELRIGRVKPLKLALFEGTFGLALGMVLALAVFVESAALQTALTNNLLDGLIFGLGASLLTMLLVPVLYFAIGFVVGYLHAWLFNALAVGSSTSVVATPSSKAEHPSAKPINPREQALGFGERMPERRRNNRSIRM